MLVRADLNACQCGTALSGDEPKLMPSKEEDSKIPDSGAKDAAHNQSTKGGLVAATNLGVIAWGFGTPAFLVGFTGPPNFGAAIVCGALWLIGALFALGGSTTCFLRSDKRNWPEWTIAKILNYGYFVVIALIILGLEFNLFSDPDGYHGP